MPASGHYSIGEVLSLLQDDFADITISKIRFLETQGLIDPERTPSGYRRFFEPDLERLRWILTQQRDHYLPLKVIRERLDAGEPFPADTEPPAPGPADPEAPGPSEADPEALAPSPPDPEALAPSPPVSEAPGAGEAGVEAPSPGREGRQSPSPNQADDRPAAAPPGPSGAGDRPGAGSDAAIVTPPRVAEAADQPAVGGPPAEAGTEAPPGAPPAAAPSEPRSEDDVPEAPQAGNPELARGAEATPAAVAGRPAPDAPAPRSGPRSTGRRRTKPAAVPDAGRGAAASPREEDAMDQDNPAEATPGPQDAGGEPVTYSRDQLAQESGCSVPVLRDLERFGLLHGVSEGGAPVFDADSLAVARLAARFASHGLDPRHLRSFRLAAEREVGMFAQVVGPLLQRRDATAHERAAEVLTELADLASDLHGVLVRRLAADELGPR